jgi:hypothetical protein
MTVGKMLFSIRITLKFNNRFYLFFNVKNHKIYLKIKTEICITKAYCVSFHCYLTDAKHSTKYFQNPFCKK